MTRGRTRSRQSKGQAAPTDRPLVLLVDDFRDNREMYADYLTFSGYRVAEAASGREAVAQARALRPDLVVMDLALPSMDGWEATRAIKRDLRTAHIPVIALTGHSLQRHARRALEAGCDNFLVKPCLPETLLEEIRRLIDETRRRRVGRSDG